MQSDITSKINIDFDSAQDFAFGIFRIDLNGNVLFANDTFLKILGFQTFQELQEHLASLSSEQLKQCFSPERLSVLSVHKSSELQEFTWISHTGTKVVLREHVHAVRDDSGVIYLDCIIENISEKDLLHKIYTDINSTDNSILRAIPDYIFVISREGNILEAKNNYQRIFPHLHNITGKHLSEIFGDHTASKMIRRICKTLQSGEKETIEFHYLVDDISYFFEARFVIHHADDVVMILRDITAQKQAEIQLENTTEALKQSNSTKDKFFSIISHDIRTPINGILNYAEILSNETDILSSEEIKEFSGYILEISRNTVGLLNNLLEWSRLQNGKISFQPGMIRLPELTEKVIGLLTPNSNAKQIQILNQIPAKQILLADENMLSSIFLNLIGNAIKFTNQGGCITVSSEEVDDCIKVCISDDGVGMSKEFANKLFNSMGSITTLGTSKEQGTGLGLILCKEFVKMHEGQIWVDSSIGKGSKFYFTISKNIKPREQD